jgi:hypothetical protein
MCVCVCVCVLVCRRWVCHACVVHVCVCAFVIPFPSKRVCGVECLSIGMCENKRACGVCMCVCVNMEYVQIHHMYTHTVHVHLSKSTYRDSVNTHRVRFCLCSALASLLS